MKKSKSQQAFDARYAFVDAVDRVLEIVGARRDGPIPPRHAAKGRLTEAEIASRVAGGDWRLDLDGTELWIAARSDWIACRFETLPTGLLRAAAVRANPHLNPHSGKWNWNFGSGAGRREALEFGRALCSLMPLEQGAPLVELLEDAARSTTVHDDVTRMQALLKSAGLDATVHAYHGVSVRLPPPAGTYFGLHTRPQFLAAVRRIEGGEPPLDVLKSVAG